MKLLRFAILLCGISFFPGTSSAQSNVAYYGLEPDIITNYLSPNARSLGYVRLTIELMIEDVDDLEAIEHHSPLLRATIIEIFGRQSEEKVKSLTGREDIRRTILDRLQTLMEKETGKKMIRNVIYTKYLYQGG